MHHAPAVGGHEPGRDDGVAVDERDGQSVEALHEDGVGRFFF